MKRILSVVAAAALLSPFVHAQTSTWKPDTAHSGVAFSILHLSLSRVPGHFALTGGELVWNEADVTKSKINVTIDVASVDTNNAARDKDLKSDKYFDVEKFGTATFTSTSVAKSSGGLTVQGNLTLHGVTKPVTLQVEGPNGPVNGMDKKPHVGFSATTTIDRTAFGIAPSTPSAVVGTEVKLTIDMDFAKQ